MYNMYHVLGIAELNQKFDNKFEQVMDFARIIQSVFGIVSGDMNIVAPTRPGNKYPIRINYMTKPILECIYMYHL